MSALKPKMVANKEDTRVYCYAEISALSFVFLLALLLSCSWVNQFSVCSSSPLFGAFTESANYIPCTEHGEVRNREGEPSYPRTSWKTTTSIVGFLHTATTEVVGNPAGHRELCSCMPYRQASCWNWCQARHRDIAHRARDS